MNKFAFLLVKRLLSLLLICVLVLSVDAAEVELLGYSSSGGESSGRAVVLPDLDSGNASLVFSMTATEVRQFLSSESSGKTFRPLELGTDVESIFYSGTIYSSAAAAGGNYRVSVGIGFNSYHDGVFTEKDSIRITHGAYFGSDETRIDIDEFNRTTRYYAFIKNEFPNNGFSYAWGNVYVYASSEPC